MYTVHFWRNEDWNLAESMNSVIFKDFLEAKNFILQKGFIKDEKYLYRNFFYKIISGITFYAEISEASFYTEK